MTDQTHPIARELREAEALEAGLTRLFATIQPPAGAIECVLAKLAELEFHESELTLDDAAPFSFEQALQAQAYEGADLLAAGLEADPEDAPIDEAELDPDDQE